ncbi:origin of replication complex subunit 4 isoform X2 [Selaginella moellendorffii]|uniref:origin of replication complex subunit 4 isoform X2 n=1 Tax=Selaginella moellendorffii TaxID=88036 RepID=UPI000D1C4B53|nr:origin of replication complex subunit 4 isoform X2 [Selaginella moellendorffii]|eukprot:XP_024529265.1 origin of replication complex subunit 4 isoform X2 [Selaginella moellendorffii]
MDAAMQILRCRLYDPRASPVFASAEENRRKLYDLFRHTICQACNNSALLLGPRGCGARARFERNPGDFSGSNFDRREDLLFVISPLKLLFCCFRSQVRLNGLLHADDRSALKEIAKQLCVEHELEFSKAASFEENLRFLTVILEQFSLSHKALVLVLDEFDLFAQKPKQSLLYNLLDLLQSPSSQAAVIGISCRLDADQLLEKRVRSRFSQRKILFLPPPSEEITRFLEAVLVIPVDSSANLAQHANAFNAKISAWLQMETTKELVNKLAALDSSPRNIIDSVFRNLLDYLKNTKSTTPKHPPTICALADLSVLELFLLTSMKRLENKERDTYTFNSVFKEYQDGYKSSDSYSKKAAYKAFEHLLERELIGYSDGRAVSTLSHLRPVKMLISFEELEQGLEASPICPATLRQWYSQPGDLSMFSLITFSWNVSAEA